jgi:hypothetical protein
MRHLFLLPTDLSCPRQALHCPGTTRGLAFTVILDHAGVVLAAATLMKNNIRQPIYHSNRRKTLYLTEYFSPKRTQTLLTIL